MRLPRTRTIWGFAGKKCALLLICSGCTTAKLVGYINSDSDRIAPALSTVSISADEFEVLRDPTTNALEVEIVRSDGNFPFHSIGGFNYELTFTATTSRQLPRIMSPNFVSPILFSPSIKLYRCVFDETSSTLKIIIRANRVGKDMVIAMLSSPSGLNGIVVFERQRIAVPFTARYIKNGTTLAAIYKSEGLLRDKYTVQSMVEIPLKYIVDMNTVSRQLIIRSWRNASIHTPWRFFKTKSMLRPTMKPRILYSQFSNLQN